MTKRLIQGWYCSTIWRLHTGKTAAFESDRIGGAGNPNFQEVPEGAAFAQLLSADRMGYGRADQAGGERGDGPGAVQEISSHGTCGSRIVGQDKYEKEY